MHPLVASASEAGLQPDIASSLDGIGQRFDVEMTGAASLTLDEVRDLARRIGCACGAAGNRGPALRWRNDALAVLGARERELIAGSNEDTTINLGTDGTRLPAPSIGSGAERRAARARQGYRRR